jgi:hypothetical protein
MERQMKNQLASQKKAFQEKIYQKLKGILLFFSLLNSSELSPKKISNPTTQEKTDSFLDDQVKWVFALPLSNTAVIWVTSKSCCVLL